MDLAVQAFDAEGTLALDVQVLHAFSHRLGDCAVADAERNKIEKYRGACALINMSFHPIVMDTLGNFGPVSLKMVQKIISKAAERSDSPPEAALDYCLLLLEQWHGNWCCRCSKCLEHFINSFQLDSVGGDYSHLGI